MKRRWKQFLAGIMTAVMLMGVLPAPAYASIGQLIENGAVQNAALLEALREVYGDDAEAYLAVLRQYGLVDEKGNLVTDEKIVVDGVEYTLAELEDYLATPGLDLSKNATVDGQTVSLGDLQKMLEIEQYLAELKAKYFTPQQLNDDQIASFQDFADAFANGQVQFLATGEELTGVGPAGVDHSVRASVDMAYKSGGLEVTVTLNKPQTEDVTFSWRGLSAVLEVTGTTSGQGRITAGDLKTSFKITYDDRDGTTYCAEADSALVVQLYDLTNALFAENNSSRLELSRSEDNTQWPGSTWFVKTTTDKWSYIQSWPPVIISSKDMYYGEYFYTGNRLFSPITANVKSWGDPKLQDEKGERLAWYGQTSPDQFSTVTIPSGMYGGDDALCGVELTVRPGWEKVDAVGEYYGPPGGYDNFQADARGGFFSSYNGGETANKKAEHPKVRVVVYDQTSRKELMNQTQEADLTQLTSNMTSMSLADEVFVKRSELGGWKVNVTSTVGKYSFLDTLYNKMNEFWVIPAMTINTASWTFREATTKTNATITAPAGEYYPGQSIPVTITYSYPQSIGTKATLKLNGEEVSRSGISGTRSTTFTYLYKVKETDGGTLNLTSVSFDATGANGREQDVTLSGGVQPGQAFPGVTIKTPDKTAAFTDYQVNVGLVENSTQPLLMVTVPLNKSASKWVEDELLKNGNIVSSLQVQLAEGMAADGQTKFTFTGNSDQNVTDLVAAIPLNYNLGITDLEGTVDFLLDGKVLMGEGRAYTVGGSKPVPANDIKPTLTITPADGGAGTNYDPDNKPPVLYAEQGNGLVLDFSLTGSGYTWGDKSKVTADPGDTSAHFLWKSSNEGVATVKIDDKSVSLVPTGQPGTTSITLTALNSALPDTESDPIVVEFAVGSDPFLIIPASGRTVAIRQGQDATVSWTSNICQKNQTGGAGGAFAETAFDVRLRYTVSGGDTVTIDKENLPEAVQNALTTSVENPVISSVTLPWEGLLDGIYEKDVRSLTVEISTRYLDKTYGTYDNGEGDKADTATATITMTSRPAAVTLAEPNGGLYQVDGDNGLTIPLTWTVADLDTTATGQGKFELYIVGGGLTEPIIQTKLANDGGNVTKDGNQYTYEFQAPQVELDPKDPTSYRDSYSITVKAKNAAEATWSSSSYVLYVYSDQALKIMLDGKAAGSDLTMSNREDIIALWGAGGEAGSNAIVALQRDIALKNVISANYGEYAWAELADQIAWKSSDSSVATVNYQQGTLYENIENFSYTSYRPTTDFILSGLKNGDTKITARHVNTNLTEELLVRVETLRDRLYLFQCYPKTETELTYYTWLDKEHTRKSAVSTLKTNANGEAAIYAPYGIAGDVYCKSTTTEDGQTVTWLGTIYNRNLVSSEADSTKLQLYPVNTLQLRRAAQAVIYLKNPDGTPYQGQVTFRGGVYRDGVYCTGDSGGDPVLFGLQTEQREAWKAGNVDHTATTGQDGALTVTMDVSSFKHAGNQEAVEAGDRMYYLFQLEGGTGNAYYPLFFRVDATMNIKDVAATGESIVAWEENASKTENPFVAQQTLKYNQSAASSVADVRKSTGKVGPSETFPNAWLTTNVIWWGMENATSGRTITLQDANGKVPDGQTSKIVTYPFTDLAFTEHVMKLDKSTMDSWGIASGDERAVRLALSEDGTTTSRTITLPFRVVNLIGVPKAEADKSLLETADEIKENISVDSGNLDMSFGDALIGVGLGLAASDADYDGSTNGCAIRLYATSDPTKFRALFSLSAGNMSSDDNVTGVYPTYTDTEGMLFAEMGQEDLDLMPNPKNVYNMVKGTYLENAGEEMNNALDGKGVRGYHFDVGGYFEADIVYNTASKKWECKPVTGGFHVGGGLNYNWFVNMMVGPVPVNISLTLGGTLEIGMDMQRGTYYQVSRGTTQLLEAKDQTEFDNALLLNKYTEETGNDYLTRLRLFLYIRVFAGVGFDISVVAFKVGVFGQLNLDLNFHFLNRDYLDGHKDDRISAVGPFGETRQKDYMAGQDLRFSGATGIEFVFKFLFVSYEKIFCSAAFQVGDQLGSWDTIQEIWAANKKINNAPVQRMMMPNGQVMYAVDLGPQLESRDYVDLVDQEWTGDEPRFGLFSLDNKEDSGLADELQTGAYSYANPVLSDDGEIMMYLSDRGTSRYADAKDITNTRVAVSVKSGDEFPQGTRFDGSDSVPVGYGDSNVKLTGKGSHYAAAWVRQMTDITVEGGGALSEGDQRLQMNSTEIIAATSEDGDEWTLTQLTDNSTPDLAPVVATNGTRTIVAWREVNSSDVDSLTSFDQQDAIRYKVFDGGNWSETQTLYDGTGTAASVKGLEMAMLKDGTAAVVYTLDTAAGNDSNTDWETVAALIPAEDMSAVQSEGGAETENSEDTVRTFRLTNDSDLDENPQIATAKFGMGNSAVERFVVAWHTERAISKTVGQTQSDIRLAAMDKNGALYENMPESLGRATEGTGETVGSNFRLAKNADSINDLSILWVDSVAGEISIPTEGVLNGYADTGHDVLKAVRFVEDDSSFTLSGTVEVAEMAQGTLIDHFDAYVSGTDEIKSVILGTDYSATTKKEVTISDGEKDYTATMKVANPVTGMYTATAAFTNRIEMPAVMLEYDKLFPNSDADVQFTIRNSGKAAITKLEIVSPNGDSVYYSTENDPLYSEKSLNLLPNRDLTVTAKFPTGETIENTGYIIRATFEDDSTPVELSDTLYLDIPDVGISSAQVVEEADGNRVVRYSLYNALAAKLGDEKDSWRVKVGFYADQDGTKPLVDSSGQAITEWDDTITDEYLAENAITISNKEALDLIDAGGYSGTVTLPVFLYAGEGNEIPTTGIPVYIKAWVETQEEPEQQTFSLLRSNSKQGYTPIMEYNDANNSTSLLLDNLAHRRGEDVSIDAALDNSDTGSKVTVTIQYNKLTGTETGNLIVTLFDANGNPIERKQLSNNKEKLLSLKNEEQSQPVEFVFNKRGEYVQVEFVDQVLNEANAELYKVGLTGAKVTYDPENETYTAVGTGLTSGILDIIPVDLGAKILVNDEEYHVGDTPERIDLPFGETVWTIQVTSTSEDSLSSANATYKLVLNNEAVTTSGGSGGSSIKYPVETPKDTDHGTVTVKPDKAQKGDTVTITAKPDEGYQVGKVTVTQSNGQTVSVTKKSDSTYTFTMPGGKVDVEVTFVPEGQWTNPFVDVTEGTWYYDAVKYVNENGLMAGTSANTFAPDLTTTRGMIVTILYRLEGSPNIEDEIWGYPFKDVDANAYYATAVYWARMNGIVAGYSDELFGPNDTITREQMATILYRYAQYKGCDTTAKADLSKYTDAAQVGSWALDAIRWANAEGLVNGTSATTLTPKGSATRAQVAVILTRFCQNIVK